MLRVATVNEWWELARSFPEFQRVSLAPLKDYGYLAILDYLKDKPRSRVLEFGHGMTPTLIERIQHAHDAWGVDDSQRLTYMPAEPLWTAEYRRCVVEKCPQAMLVRGLLGTEAMRCALPAGTFDLVCSVSVLEEMPLEAAQPIMNHAAELLKPGGVFINTCDVCLAASPWHPPPGQYIPAYVAAQRSAGLMIEMPAINLDVTQLLIENPTAAMLLYQHAHGEDRRYSGHWTTVLTIATKPK